MDDQKLNVVLDAWVVRQVPCAAIFRDVALAVADSKHQ